MDINIYRGFFVQQIGEITIMKEMTNAATNMMSDEEKAEIEKQLNQQYHGNNASAASASASNGGGSGTATPQNIAAEAHAEKPASAAGSSTAATANAATTGDAHKAPSPTASTTPATPEDLAAQRAALREKQRQQREKMRAQEEERRRVMKERIKILTTKLIERLRPYVEAKDPGNPHDAETVAWMKKIGKEAEDLKLESFGVELLHAIGHVYVMKGTTYLKSRKLLGL
jgi:hypothetical protein